MPSFPLPYIAGLTPPSPPGPSFDCAEEGATGSGDCTDCADCADRVESATDPRFTPAAVGDDTSSTAGTGAVGAAGAVEVVGVATVAAAAAAGVGVGTSSKLSIERSLGFSGLSSPTSSIDRTGACVGAGACATGRSVAEVGASERGDGDERLSCVAETTDTAEIDALGSRTGDWLSCAAGDMAGSVGAITGDGLLSGSASHENRRRRLRVVAEELERVPGADETDVGTADATAATAGVSVGAGAGAGAIPNDAAGDGELTSGGTCCVCDGRLYGEAVVISGLSVMAGTATGSAGAVAVAGMLAVDSGGTGGGV